jgi:hypothetical protein
MGASLALDSVKNVNNCTYLSAVFRHRQMSTDPCLMCSANGRILPGMVWWVWILPGMVWWVWVRAHESTPWRTACRMYKYIAQFRFPFLGPSNISQFVFSKIHEHFAPSPGIRGKKSTKHTGKMRQNSSQCMFSFPLQRDCVTRIHSPPSLQVSGKINFNFGPSATLFLKKRGQNAHFFFFLTRRHQFFLQHSCFFKMWRLICSHRIQIKTKNKTIAAKIFECVFLSNTKQQNEMCCLVLNQIVKSSIMVIYILFYWEEIFENFNFSTAILSRGILFVKNSVTWLLTASTNKK